jgi:hypothetical protein
LMKLSEKNLELLMSELSHIASLYNAVLNYIHQRGLEDYDDFSWKLSERIFEEFSKGNFDVEDVVKRIRTTFFRMNDITRKEFFCNNFAALAKRKWKMSASVKYQISALGRKEMGNFTRVQKQRESYKQITVDELDSFNEVKTVTADAVANLVPLKIKEDQIKAWFAEIIGEPFTQEDWGGEDRDLYSNRVKFRNKRIPTAFLLKGPAVTGSLTAAKCGRNGDQVLRLVKAYSARLFIVQYVGKIHPNLIDTLEAHVAYESRKGKKLLFCVIDGIDTARILRAYGKI